MAATIQSQRGQMRWKAEGSIRPENNWPAGTRELPCLRCDRPFTSTQRDNRLCYQCAYDTGHDRVLGGEA